MTGTCWQAKRSNPCSSFSLHPLLASNFSVPLCIPLLLPNHPSPLATLFPPPFLTPPLALTFHPILNLSFPPLSLAFLFTYPCPFPPIPHLPCLPLSLSSFLPIHHIPFPTLTLIPSSLSLPPFSYLPFRVAKHIDTQVSHLSSGRKGLGKVGEFWPFTLPHDNHIFWRPNS